MAHEPYLKRCPATPNFVDKRTVDEIVVVAHQIDEHNLPSATIEIQIGDRFAILLPEQQKAFVDAVSKARFHHKRNKRKE